MKTTSEAIKGLQMTFGQIKEKADLHNKNNCTTEEISTLTDIEKRLDKIEKANSRNCCHLQSTLKMAKTLSQKVERLSPIIVNVVSRDILGTKLKNITHNNSQSQSSEGQQTVDTAIRINGDCNGLEQKRVMNLALKDATIYKSNQYRNASAEDRTNYHLQNVEHNVEEYKQVTIETNLIEKNPKDTKKAMTKIANTPTNSRSKSGYKLCLTASGEDNRYSYHQNKSCVQGKLLQPVIQIDNKPSISKPNIITVEKKRSTTIQDLGTNGRQKRLMTMADIAERNFHHEKKVHSMDEWMEIGVQSGIEVAASLKMTKHRDKISRRGHDYLILMDISESMRGEKFNLMTKTAMEYIDGLQTISLLHGVRDNIGLACFGEETKLIMPPHADYDEIKAQIGKLKPGGPSPLAAGLVMAYSGIGCYPETQFGDYEFSPCIIVMTDGEPTGVKAETEDESAAKFLLSPFWTMERDIKVFVRLLSRKGIKIYWIPFGSAHKDIMNEIVTTAHGKIIPHNQILRLCRMTLNFNAASQIAPQLERIGNFEREMVKGAVRIAGLQEYDAFDDITDNVMMLLDPALQYSGHFKEPKWRAIPLGTRVRRGPDWKWDNQDKHMAGTVVGEDNDGKIHVEWDNGYRNRYDYDENSKIFDIKVVNEPRRLVDELIAVGCKVKRGKDWKFGDQDGGAGNMGTVLRVDLNGKTAVKWDMGRLRMYKFGSDGLFELEVCDHPQTLISSDLILPLTQDTNPSSTFTNVSEAAETPFILPIHKNKNITSSWQYQDVDGQWSSYDGETNAKIESAFNRNSNGKCIIEINNLIYIVKFTRMVQENPKDKTVVPVQRLEVKNEEEDDP